MVRTAVAALLLAAVAARADDPPAPGWQGEPDPPAEPVAWPADGPTDVAVGSEVWRALVFADPGGRYVLAGKAVHDLRTGRKVGELPAEPAVGPPFALSPDGARMAAQAATPNGPAARNAGPVYVFDVPAGKVLTEIAVADWPPALAFLGPDRVVCHYGFQDPPLRAYDAATGKKVWDAPAADPVGGRPRLPNTALAVSPGRRWVAVAEGFRVRVLRADTGAVAGALTVAVPPTVPDGARSWCGGLTFSPDGARLAAVYGFAKDGSSADPADTRAYTWDLRTGREIGAARVAPVSAGDVQKGQALRWAADGSVWLVTDTHVVDPQTGKTVWRLPRHYYSTWLRWPVAADRVWEGHPNRPRARLVALPADRIAAGLKAVRAGGGAIDAWLPPAVAPDLRAAPAANPTGRWAVDPDPAPAVRTPADLPDLPARPASLESVRVAGGRRPGVLAEWVTRADPRGPGTATATVDEAAPRVVERSGLADGKPAGKVEIPGGCRVTHAGPDAALAVTVTADEDRDRVDVWDVEAGKHVVGWRPYATSPPPERAVTFAAAPAADRVVTVNPAGHVGVWALPGATPVARVPCRGFRTPTLTPGGAYLIGVTDAGVRVIHTRTGQVAGELPVPGRPRYPDYPGLWLAVRPDGKELVGLLNRDSQDLVLARWDLTAGGRPTATPLGQRLSSALTSPVWQGATYTGPDHLLIAGRFLYDLRRKEVVWQYQLGRTEGPRGVYASQAPDARVWYAAPTGDGRWGVTAAELPAGPERAAVRAATADNPRLGPGAKVGVAVDLEGDHPDIGRDAVTAAVADLAKARGWNVVEDGAEVTLVFAGKTGPWAYGPWKMDYTVSVLAGGAEVWSSVPHGMPGDVPRGKSLADPAVRRQVAAGVAKSVGSYLTAGDHLPAHLGRTDAAGYVAVPGMTVLSAGDPTAVGGRTLGAGPPR